MSDIPSDLFTNILSLLPVQSLLRFRSTSKSLRILIDSHNFINLHLKNSLNFNLILRYESKFYQIDFPNLTTCVPLNSPLTFNIQTILLGSCNGLLCICDNKSFAFWNPNLRKHWIIPKPPHLHRSDSATPYILGRVNGFGFDPLTGDYKLVRITRFGDGFNFFDAELTLFCSRTNSWKLLSSMPYVICPRVGVFVHHSLHWVATRNSVEFKNDLIVVAINLTLENFNEVPLPPDIGNREGFYFEIEVLGGCLCMVVNYGGAAEEIDVWVMKEYGSRDSWCKLFTLMNSPCFSRPLNHLRPLGYSSDGKKVLLRVNNRLFWYDLMSEKVLSCVTGIPYWEEAMIFVESLVPPACFPIESQNMSKCEIKSKTRGGESKGRTSNSVSETGCSRCLWFWK